MLSVEGFTTLIEDIIMSQLVAPIMAYNRPNAKTCPRVHMSLVDTTTLSELADFVRKLGQLREIFEPAAASLAAQRCNALQLKQIETAYRAMEAAQNTDEWAAADLQFHEAVLVATHNELMVSLFSVVETALGSFFVQSARKSRDFKYSLPYHRQVFEAIRRRQPDMARHAMQQMIADSSANMSGKRRARQPA